MVSGATGPRGGQRGWGRSASFLGCRWPASPSPPRRSPPRPRPRPAGTLPSRAQLRGHRRLGYPRDLRAIDRSGEGAVGSCGESRALLCPVGRSSPAPLESRKWAVKAQRGAD
ncbi:Hypothetical predicted protein [Marmota monax]|uniref:Uncharacterized protein n=1 Tax=Marmota monax TaxID=9995 RepID=A0A5E4CDB4_MARMO|nr:hypothetical protein GHT09_008242 [Marmota monax]VTJ79934.1 Hypothetical predicted protein [Marmota monax]